MNNMKKLLIILLLSLLHYLCFSQYYTSLQYAAVIYTSALSSYENGIIKYNIFSNYSQIGEGENLVNSETGVELPYVSGFGNDQIFDLSIMQDTHFNKNAYAGNAFGLPEYYNFPYDTLYYDVSNPYYWKIKDFHYRHYENQANALTNLGFAKLTYTDEKYTAKCTTSGIAYNNCSNAYGEWEFDLTKTSGTSTIYFNFLADRVGGGVSFIGYQFVVGGSENVTLRRAANGVVSSLFATASGYFPMSISVRIKITRTTNGEFSVYIKGSSFGNDYILIDVTGGSGSNPVIDNTITTCNYSVLDFDAGNDISYYFINNSIENFNNYTQTTGVYELSDNLKSSDELLLYESEQVEPALNNIKNYIGLIPGTDFYKNEY